MKIKTNRLRRILIDIFKRHNLNSSHALICADALINAELVGAPTHGLSRLKMYCDRINKKVINPKPIIKIKKFHNPLLILMQIIVLVSSRAILELSKQLKMQRRLE